MDSAHFLSGALAFVLFYLMAVATLQTGSYIPVLIFVGIGLEIVVLYLLLKSRREGESV